MIKNTKAFSSFAVSDLHKAKEFYGTTLGLTVTEEEMGVLALHMKGDNTIMIYPKTDHSPAPFTILNFLVADIEKTVDELTRSGIRFEHYEGEIETDEKGIARGQGPTIAWFTDPAGNILSVIEENDSGNERASRI